MQSFWKPIKSKNIKLSSNFGMPNLKVYPKRTLKENRLIAKNPYGDSDGDKVMNYFDCKPLDKKQDSKMLRKEIEKNIWIRSETPKYAYNTIKTDSYRVKRFKKRLKDYGMENRIQPKYKAISKKDILTYFEKNPDSYKSHLDLQTAMRNKYGHVPEIILKARKRRNQAGSYHTGHYDRGDISIPILQQRRENIKRIIEHELQHGKQDVEGVINSLIDKDTVPGYYTSKGTWIPTRRKKHSERPIEIDVEKRIEDNISARDIAKSIVELDRNVPGQPQTLNKVLPRMRTGRAPILEAKKITLYHGTESENVQKKILKEGLKPVGYTFHEGTGHPLDEGIVFMSPRKSYARSYGKNMVKITLPINETMKILKDVPHVLQEESIEGGPNTLNMDDKDYDLSKLNVTLENLKKTDEIPVITKVIDKKYISKVEPRELRKINQLYLKDKINRRAKIEKETPEALQRLPLTPEERRELKKDKLAILLKKAKDLETKGREEAFSNNKEIKSKIDMPETEHRFPRYPNSSVAFDFVKKKGLINKRDKYEMYEKFSRESPEKKMNVEDKKIYAEVLKERKIKWEAKKAGFMKERELNKMSQKEPFSTVDINKKEGFTIGNWEVNKNPELNKLLKKVSTPLKIIEAEGVIQNRTGKPFAGMIDYDTDYIVLNKKIKMTNKDKARLIIHEMGHVKLRESGIKENSDLGLSKKAMNELKKTKVYQIIKKENYLKHKLPEEAFATYYELLHGVSGKPGEKERFDKKYPTLSKEFNEKINRKVQKVEQLSDIESIEKNIKEEEKMRSKQYKEADKLEKEIASENIQKEERDSDRETSVRAEKVWKSLSRAKKLAVGREIGKQHEVPEYMQNRFAAAIASTK